jgi:hypothetical protein
MTSENPFSPLVTNEKPLTDSVEKAEGNRSGSDT